jgi:RNA-binding protein 26
LNKVQIDRASSKAILIYANHDSAAKAWNDPRPVFNNRFVKIWWKKSDPSEPSQEQKEQVDIKAEREKALRAQKEHEERERKKEELEKQKYELERKAVEIAEKQRIEKERLMEKIKRAQAKAKGNVNGISASGETTPVTPNSNSPEMARTQINGNAAKNGETSKQPEDENSRKAQLKKMLNDLKDQVLLNSTYLTI